MVSSTFAREPWLAIVLVLGILIALGALFLRLNTHRLRRAARRRPRRRKASYVPMFAHLALVFMRRHLSAAAAGRLVPERREAAGMSAMRAARQHPARRHGRTASALAARRRRRTPAGTLRSSNLPAAACTLLGLWGEPAPCTWRCSTRRRRRSPSSTIACTDGDFPSVGAMHPPASASSARSTICSAWSRPARRTAALARSRPLGRRASARQTHRRRRPQPYAFLPAEGEACTRFRSVRCMPASSSPDISASPPTARRWCGWSSGSAMCTRASKSLMAGATLERAAQARRPRVRRQHGRLCLRLCAGGRSRAGGQRRRRAPSICAR